MTLGVAREAGPVAVIGDVHGRLDLLDKLLAQLGDLPLFVMGDVIDRGPDSAGVIERLVSRGARGVLGNHETWLLDWLGGRPLEVDVLRPGMGGAATLRSYGVRGDMPGERERIPAHHRAWLASLPVALDLGVGDERYWLVHAGIPTDVTLEVSHPAEVVPWLAEARPDELLWSRTLPADTLPVDRTVIMGHLRLKRPVDHGFVIAVDTGCGKPGGRLTAVILPERRFVTVEEDAAPAVG